MGSPSRDWADVNDCWIDPPPALVHGYAARALAVFLRVDLDGGRFAYLPAEGQQQVACAVRGIERAAAAWMATVGSEFGITKPPRAEVGSHGAHEEFSIDEAAGLLGITPRRVRTMAAEGLGRKLGGRWILSRADVLAELERRAAA